MLTDPWLAPVAAGPVAARVTVPGSKSLANRALVLASLADAPSHIGGLPVGARDLTLMTAALAGLGATITPRGSGEVTVTPGSVSGKVAVDCGLAGTVMRFVPPVAALGPADVRFDGDPRARERPMGPMLVGLRALGIDIDDGGRARLPFTVRGRGAVPGGQVDVDASGSSQFVTALLLSAARFDLGAVVRHRGGPIPSLPHIDMTVRMLGQHGVTVTAEVTDRTSATWRVPPSPIGALDRHLEPDLSNAAPFIALAVVTGGQVLIRDWPADSLQPAAAMMAVFEALGATFTATPNGMLAAGTGRVTGIDADLRDLGELVPTITAVCAVADTDSHLTGIGHIAGHETDRLVALAVEINGLGGDVTADAGSLRVRPASLRGGRWRTYHDHRMATCGSIIGAVTPGVLIEDVATTAKTFPDFPTTWREAVDTGRAPDPDRGE